jgi:hypothetical protein
MSQSQKEPKIHGARRLYPRLKRELLPEYFDSIILMRSYRVTGNGVATIVHPNIIDLSVCRNLLAKAEAKEEVAENPAPETPIEDLPHWEHLRRIKAAQKHADDEYAARVVYRREITRKRVVAMVKKRTVRSAYKVRMSVLESHCRMEQRREIARKAALYLVREVWGKLDPNDPPKALWCRTTHPNVRGGVVRLTYDDCGSFQGWQFTIAKLPGMDSPEEHAVYLLENMTPWVRMKYGQESHMAPRVRRKRFPLLEDLVLRHLEIVQPFYILNPEVADLQRQLAEIIK